jgi:glyoxylase-like metal-dependent hydrolase (beta-lactamase superfamily II)
MHAFLKIMLCMCNAQKKVVLISGGAMSTDKTPSHMDQQGIENLKEQVANAERQADQDTAQADLFMVDVHAVFDYQSMCVTYVVADPKSRKCVVIDPITNFDFGGCKTSYEAADQVIEIVRDNSYTVDLILETDIHVDHVTASGFLKRKLGGQICISKNVETVASTLSRVFNVPSGVWGSQQFDHVFQDQQTFKVGAVDAMAIQTPGYSQAGMCYLIGDALFVGGLLFMPDLGTPRCDLPGGNALDLYKSVQRLWSLPEETRVFVGRDFGTEVRDVIIETSIEAQRFGNITVAEGISEEEFVTNRKQHDASLPWPAYMYQAMQLNMNLGGLPEPEDNGIRYLKLPLNVL